MNTPAPSRRSSLPGILVSLAVLGLVAYYFWPHGTSPTAGADTASAATAADPSASASEGPLPPGAVSNVGGIPLDAEGHRIVNSAGLPISNEPLPQAKPIPIKAPAGAVIGYTRDAQGNAQPVRAGDLKQIPNTPGSYAVVDMWADGGPTVIPATELPHLSDAELKRMQAAERARQEAETKQP